MPDYDLIVVGGGPSGCSAAVTAAKRGLRVLLLEREKHNRIKPCGGLLPMAASDVVKDVFGSDIPSETFSEPKNLGLFYIPPSGIANGGRVSKYRIINLNRTSFDEWLRIRAESVGVDIHYGAQLADFSGRGPVKVKIIRSSGVMEYASADRLVGADGVFSGVRKQLFGEKDRVKRVVHESWSKMEELDDFYVILDGRLSSMYSYAIPKTETIEIGLGLNDNELKQYSSSMESLRSRLESTLSLSFNNLITRRIWAIPYGFTSLGEGNVLLVGDAAGFCNPLSGEGIRLGIESGEAAGSAVADAVEKHVNALSIYSDFVSQLVALVTRVYEYSSKFNDNKREQFVEAELDRISLD